MVATVNLVQTSFRHSPFSHSLGSKIQYGKVYYVDNEHTAASDGNLGTSPDKPLSTWDGAINRVSSDSGASTGATLIFAPSHTETISAAGGVAMDVAGITCIFLGEGAARPTFTFSATAATVLVTAASCKILGFPIFTPSVDSVVSPLVVQAADFEGEIEFQDASSTVEFVRGVLTNASADRLKLDIKYIGNTGGNAVVNAVRLVGCNNGRINVDFFGIASTAVVEFLTTACTDIKVTGYTFNSGTTDGSKNVVDTQGSSTWFAEIYDGSAGAKYSGGSAAALASDDVSAVNTVLGTISSAAATGAVTSTDVIMAYLKQLVTMAGPAAADTDPLAVAIYGAGITTWPTSVAPANAVNLFEAVRDIWDALRNGTGGAEPGTNKSVVDAIGFDGAAAVTATAGMLRVMAGTTFEVKKTLTSSAVLTTGVDVTGVSAGGDIEIISVHAMTDGTGLAAGTLFTLETDNAKGKAVFLSEAVADLGANATEISYLGNAGLTDAGSFAPILESGKKVVAKCTGTNCTGTGTVDVYLVCRRLADGASLAAA